METPSLGANVGTMSFSGISQFPILVRVSFHLINSASPVHVISGSLQEYMPSVRFTSS